MKIKHSTNIGIGFTVILLLLGALIIIGVFHVDNMNERLNDITSQHDLKSQYVTEIREGIRKRQISIRNLFLTDDAFDRDEEVQRFFSYARSAAEARNKLLGMKLTANEKKMIDKISGVMKFAYPIQNKLVGRLVFDAEYEANKEKLNSVMKAQEDIIVLLNELELIQSAGRNQAVKEAHLSYQDAKFALLYLGSLAFFLGVLIAGFVLRYTRRQEKRVRRSIDELTVYQNTLEKRVEDRTEELAVARDKAMASSRAKGQFLANMSHELRTPLNAIIGYSEIMQEEIQECGEQGMRLLSDIMKILVAGRHLLSLINEVLDLSKIEAGKMDMYIEQFDIKEMLDDVITNVTPLMKKNNNRIEIDTDKSCGCMSADITKVRQILLNLLSNASKFSNEGTIKLEVSRENITGCEWVRFSVIDNGIGMSEEQMEKLFVPFSQADLSTTRKYGGTGLGLTISKYFTEMMGGELEVNSKLGKGSQFSVYLPVITPVSKENEQDIDTKAADPASARLVELAGDRNERRNRICTVLVIDDDATVRDMLVRYMSKDGFKVVTAANGADGVAMAKKLQPDVISLDVMMPTMDGWSVLRELKNDENTADIPVIMLSIIDEKSFGYALGATDYLIKPVDWGRMLTVIKRLVRNTPGNYVLVVEDDPSVCEMTKRMLEKEGFEVVTSGNGVEALAHIRQRKPALVLLDLMMPVMDGFEFMKELRDHSEWRSIPVVVLTAAELSISEQEQLQGSVRKIIQKAGLDKQSLLKEVGGIMKKCYAQSNRQ